MTQATNRKDPAARGGGLPWPAAVFYLAVLIWIVTPPAVAKAADGAVAFKFLGDVETAADYIWVSDIARFIDGDSAHWERISAERISYGPQPGDTVVLSAETVIGRLAERGYDWRRFVVSGAAETRVTAASQTAGAGYLAQAVADQASIDLKVAVAFDVSRSLPEPVVRDGELTIRLRYPDKAGTWLPDGIELLVDNMVVKTIPLGQYGSFRLPVVVAPDGIAPRTLVSAGYLASVEKVLRPGSEVAVSATSVTGMTTTARIIAGGMVVDSKLRIPYAISRGDEVVLVLNTGGIEMRARAEAMNNAYLGQRLLVKRVDDGERFTGVVEDGPIVVVE